MPLSYPATITLSALLASSAPAAISTAPALVSNYPQQLGGSGGGGTTPTLVSAAIRSRIPQQSNSNTYPGALINANPYSYTRYNDRSNKAVTGLRACYANIVTCSNTFATGINSNRQEQGVGVSQVVRGQFVTGPTNATGTGVNVGGTAATMTWNDALNGNTFTSYGRTIAPIAKLDNTQTPPAMVAKSYAQFQADGGAISSSTVNGSTLAASQITVPDGYRVWCDAGPSVAAQAAYFLGLEERTPVTPTITSIVPDGAGNIVVNTTAADVSLLRVGNFGTIAAATGNTSVNGTWLITATNPGTSITFASSTATSGAVTGGNLKFAHPTGVVNASVTANPLADYQHAAAAQADVMGSSDWTAVSASNVATDGTILSGFAAVVGTDATGSSSLVVFGDSIVTEVRDGQTDSPSALLHRLHARRHRAARAQLPFDLRDLFGLAGLQAGAADAVRPLGGLHAGRRSRRGHHADAVLDVGDRPLDHGPKLDLPDGRGDHPAARAHRLRLHQLPPRP